MYNTIQSNPDFLSTGLFKFPDFSNYFLGPLNLPEENLLSYSDFSSFIFSNFPIFRTYFKVSPLEYPQFFKLCYMYDVGI